nr:MAG TPA: hypothetical protein [Inoviridae sp.]DAI32429.1 MAG TPA: hypothetical protein [Inoviridae sp.]
MSLVLIYMTKSHQGGIFSRFVYVEHFQCSSGSKLC